MCIFPFRNDSVASARSTRTKRRMNNFCLLILRENNCRLSRLVGHRMFALTFQLICLVEATSSHREVGLSSIFTGHHVGNAVSSPMVIVNNKVRSWLPIQLMFNRRVIGMPLTRELISRIRHRLLSNVRFGCISYDSCLNAIFLSTFNLVFLVLLRPIRRVSFQLILNLLSSNFAVYRFGSSINFSFVNDGRNNLILPTEIFVHFKSSVRLRVFVKAFTVPVSVRMRAFISIT